MPISPPAYVRKQVMKMRHIIAQYPEIIIIKPYRPADDRMPLMKCLQKCHHPGRRGDTIRINKKDQLSSGCLNPPVPGLSRIEVLFRLKKPDPFIFSPMPPDQSILIPADNQNLIDRAVNPILTAKRLQHIANPLGVEIRDHNA